MVEEKVMKKMTNSECLTKKIADFCREPENFKDGHPMSVYEVSRILGISYQTCNKNVHVLDLKRLDPKAKENQKFAPWIKVWKAATALFVWPNSVEKTEYENKAQEKP